MEAAARYYKGAPTPQAAVDIFRGEWACRLPPELGEVTAGAVPAFENDYRVAWGCDRLAEFGVPVDGADVLELGPLEGAHTYGLCQRGAKSVVAVEANAHAYLKCLVVKELLGLGRVNFLFGDALEYLRATDRTFDVGFASGILYHSAQPVEMIEALCRRSRAVFLWTHYFDAAFNADHPQNGGGRDGTDRAECNGFRYTRHLHRYGDGIQYDTFWGGPAPFSYWLERDDIAAALRHFGFSRQAVVYDQNVNGSALRLAAVRD